MENANILYEKKFLHTLEAYEADLDETVMETSDIVPHDSAAFVKRLIESSVRIVMPDRVENQGFFIAQARDVAEHNEIDTIVTEYEDRLIAEFRIRDESTNYGIKGIIAYADDVFFGCDEGEVVLSVVYYTHATYRSGKQISPDRGKIL